MKAVRLLALFALLTQVLDGHAQLAQEPRIVQSPNAGSLGLYGQVPVSLFTGIPSISIPIYELHEGTIAVPISLSYHASGFRPDVHPGWVGVGWNLNVGGVITRIQHGWPDEMDWLGTGKTSNCTKMGYCYNFTDHNLNGPDWESLNAQCGLISDADHAVPNIAGFRRDTEPDEFSFNFGDYSGKFYWSSTGNGSTTGKWRVQCDKAIRVEFINPPSPLTPALLDIPFTAQYSSTFWDGQSSYPKTFSGFVIITEDGTRYQFGGSTSAIEYSLEMYNQLDDYWKASAWNLTKITSPAGREVTFQYEAAISTFIAQMYLSISFGSYDVPDKGFFSGFFSSTAVPACSGAIRGVNTYLGQLIRPVYLSSINTSTTNVSFTSSYTSEMPYSTDIFQYKYNEHLNLSNQSDYTNLPNLFPFVMGDRNSPDPAVSNPAQIATNYLLPQIIGLLKWKKLTSITANVSGVNVHNFSFSYVDNPTQRLMLTGMTENSVNSSAVDKPAYKFGYNKNAIFAMPYLREKTDHWGFYNATYSGGSSYDPNNYAQKRDANPDSSVYLSGVLTKILYPTGGITTFEYEQNRYSKQVGLDRSQVPGLMSYDLPAGGLRIARIKSFTKSNSSPILTKQYNYSSGYSNNSSSGRSSGILGGQIQYYQPSYRYYACPCGTSSTNCQNSSLFYDVTMFSVQSALPACYTGQGSHIGYSEVTEKLNDGSYTRHYFSNFDTGTNQDDMPAPTSTSQPGRTPYGPYSSREHERGKLLRQSMYTASDVLVKDKSTVYSAFNKDREFARTVQAGYFNICSTANSIFTGVASRYYTYPYLPQYETETVYNLAGNNPVTTYKTMDYHLVSTDFNSRLLAYQRETNSRGQVQETYFKYPFDYAYPNQPPSSDPSASALTAMPAKNMLSYPVEVAKYTNNNLTEAAVQTYKGSTINGINNTAIFPYQRFSFENAQPVPTYNGVQFSSSSPYPLTINNNDSRVKLKLTFDSYDAKGNVLGTTGIGGSKTAYSWGYNNTSLIAKAVNAAPNEVFDANFEDGTGWDSYLLFGSTHVLTGLHAGYITNYSQGYPINSFSTNPLTLSLTTAKNMVLSGWVYSEGPNAQLWLHMYKPGETGYGSSYVDYVDTREVNKWVYLEKEITVPFDVTSVVVRLTNFYRGSSPAGGNVWFDDIRIHPADAQMTTYTYRPEIGVTSVSDVNNRPQVYEYDGLGRLLLIRDQDGNVIKQYQYHYKNQ